MKELAHASRRRKHRSIESIPEFRQHLDREGLTFEQWERRNKPAASDLTTEALKLRMRILKSKFK